MLEARFHRIDLPGLHPHIHWQATLHDDEAGACGTLPYPVAVAWLTDFSDVPDLACVLLDYILVPDPYRRSGYATTLIGLCRERWSNLELTEPISPEGEGLLASIEGSVPEV